MRVLYAKVFGGLLMVYLLFSQLAVVKVCAAEWETTTEEKEVQETYQTVFDSMFKELDFEQVEPYAKTYLPQKMSFRTMVQNLCTKNSGENFMQTITDWLWDLFFYELRLVKPFFTQILFLIVIFSCVRPLFLDGSTYVHSLGFLMIYSALASILLQNFLMLAQLAQESMGKMEQYLQALIPSYAAVLPLRRG